MEDVGDEWTEDSELDEDDGRGGVVALVSGRLLLVNRPAGIGGDAIDGHLNDSPELRRAVVAAIARNIQGVLPGDIVITTARFDPDLGGLAVDFQVMARTAGVPESEPLSPGAGSAPRQ